MGPTQPPRLPKELIKPMDAAAADAVRNMLGNDQNAGKYAFNPPIASVNSATVSHSVPFVNGVAAMASAPKKIGTDACQRRSRVRSEFQPTNSCPTIEPIGGMITSQPTF